MGWVVGDLVKRWRLIPESDAKVFPDYIPQQIREDYVEASKIKELSPKASATLSRRCLQGMIRDFWGTPDGLAVTTARFSVRNSRKQFLRVLLPEGADLWSATVDGKPEKPAISSNGGPENGNGHPPEILVKVINSVQGFPVELIYATPMSAMGRLGRVSSSLPRPDMVVTRSRWDLYLG